MTAQRTRDLPTAEALVQLRLLVESAVRDAQDTSPASRHRALIELDAACEYALRLAADEHTIDLGRDRGGVSELVGTVASARPAWRLRAVAAVRQMHRARNSAQHAAIIPHSRQLTTWVDAVVAFVDSLCIDAFDVALQDIMLTNAVRDEELQQLLSRAEALLDPDGPAVIVQVAPSRSLAVRPSGPPTEPDAVAVVSPR